MLRSKAFIKSGIQYFEKLDRFLPFDLCGKKEKMQELFGKRYWRKDTERIVKETRQKTAGAYLLLISLLLILIFFFAISALQQGEEVKTLSRPEYGEPVKTERLFARMEYGGKILEKATKVKVFPQVRSVHATEKALEQFEQNVEIKILGKNKDIKHVCTDLFLFTKEEGSDVAIEWFSNKPELLSREGKVDTILAKGKEQNVELTAVYSLGEIERKITFPVHITSIEGANDKTTLEERLSNAIENVEEGPAVGTRLTLPKTLGEEVRIRWIEKEKNPLPELLLLFVVVFGIIYRLRYKTAENEVKTDQKAILNDLPDFTNKLLLLLSAGLVSESAIRKITTDYRKRCSKKQKPLYEGFCEIEQRMQLTNASFLKEFSDFAQKSGVRELIRLQTIISENMYIGNSLSEKLETEAAMLWFYKKKSVEERGQLAETKLTFPLLLQLIILMMITLAPVFLKL